MSATDLTPRPGVLTRSVPLVDGHRQMTFADSRATSPRPGQFYLVSLPGIGEFPVSIAGFAADASIVTCIRRTGRVTAALFAQPEGTAVGLRGPCGNGFPLEDFAGRDALLIAGGLGMAPMRALLGALLESPWQARTVTLLYGARNPATLLYAQELRALAGAGRIRLRFSVDVADGHPFADQPELCRIGLVTALLEDLPAPGPGTVAAACGPPVLYGCLLEELAAAGVPAHQVFATLERRMRCGVGSCCHCVAAGVAVCREGPVFSLAQLRRMPGGVEGIP